jgi:branched-subunit amino acid aminotransferase/4-amino-4-deoxychorismate lyase
MIWTRGEIVPDDALRISALDRTFEHGLGLFETFRTWNGHATLLDRHRERMRRSADELGLSFEPDDLPDSAAVLRLKEAAMQAGSGDVRLRIVLSGGLPVGCSASTDPHPGADPVLAEHPTRVWMTAGPLPPPTRTDGARILRLILADPQDPLARHKTLNYWRRRIEQARAADEGADEVLCATPDGLICEGTRSNIFLVRDGRLITPGTDGPLLDGVMRRVVIEHARIVRIPVVEGSVSLEAIGSADEAFLTNSVRGILPVARLLQADLPAPGPLTRRIWDEVRNWLESGGPTP